MSAAPGREDLRALPPERLVDLARQLGERPFRARQLFRWLHRRGAASLDEMTDLPLELRQALAARFEVTALERADERRAGDGTVKWTWRARDGALVESVYMPHDRTGDGEAQGNRERRTLCLSTQVGCAVGCPFCLTGTMGLRRNLSAGEIVDQVHRANRRLVELGEGPAPRPLTNLVFMGMGEPLHNVEALLPAIGLLLHPEGPDFSHRHVTVSTSGIVPAMARLGAETKVKLAVSLNATTDALRDRLVPVNRRWPIAELLAACRRFPVRQGRRITFEYVLLGGVNDRDDDARRLARLVADIPAKVNLIPYTKAPAWGSRPRRPGAPRPFATCCWRLASPRWCGGTAAATSLRPAASSRSPAGPVTPAPGAAPAR
jgi:23S rRNA (adenine2503-C2)-methyltransferase